MSAETDAARVAAGIDASRRVGWAKFFDAKEDLEAAQKRAMNNLRWAVLLALRIRYSERIPSGDPMVAEAELLLADLESRPEGRKFVESMKKTL